MAVYTTVNDAGAYFKTVLYTGTGSSLGVTGVGFQPDFTWIKNRDATDFHVLTDAVRGVTKYIKSNDTTAETTNVESLKTFDSDGFTVGTQVEVNTNTEGLVSWNWKADGAGSSGSGSLTNTRSTNTTSGFSIIKYTSTQTTDSTIAHGLGSAPQCILIKQLGGTNTWIVNNSSQTNQYFILNTTASMAGFDWIGVDATNITLKPTWGEMNITGDFICYAWKDIAGYSKFSSYEGNANADGAFVYTGFRPAFVICKTTSGGSWWMFDNKREGYNFDNDPLVAEDTTVEATTDMIDLLSNGFKMRIATDPNKTEPYIYMAWAESPFVNSKGAPTNAR